MFRALLYLRLTSLRNMVAFRIRRMRQPKYLIGTVFAVLYLYYFLVRRQSMGASGAGPVLAGAASISTAFLCGGAAAVFLIRIAFAWISPPENAGLRFSEAEISFLFPAPVTRRMLIHFRLVSAQIAILVTSALIVLFFRRFGSPGGSRVLHVIGWWVILSTFDLHLNGTNLTLVRLKEIGRGYLLWRMAAVAVILLYAGAVVLSAAAYINAHAVGSAVGVSEMRFAG
ncbi:MAG TPA: putative ABC exporter domain-containing protein, partial [Opitutaceae bacterium]